MFPLCKATLMCIYPCKKWFHKCKIFALPPQLVNISANKEQNIFPVDKRYLYKLISLKLSPSNVNGFKAPISAQLILKIV